MRKRITNLQKGKSLKELDDFYNQTVVHLPLNVRVEYVRSLIMRCKYDLSEEFEKAKMVELKRTIKAARKEILYLRMSVNTEE